MFKNKLPEGIIVDKLLRKNSVGLLTMVIDRKFLTDKNKPFDPELHNIGDFDILIKINVYVYMRIIETRFKILYV